MVFVNSMSDLFHEDLTFPQIAAVFGVMAAADKHTFQVLTKRPERMRDFFDWLDGMAERASGLFPDDGMDWRRRHVLHAAMLKHATSKAGTGSEWPIPNVWLGTSVEDQATADERIPRLRECPAAVRFVSAEPLLGEVDLSQHMWPVCKSVNSATGEVVGYNRQKLLGADYARTLLNWVIVGGESGAQARACDASWVRKIVVDCERAEAAVFVKQLGKRVIHHGMTGPGEHWPDGTQRVDNGHGTFDINLGHHKGAEPDEWPEDLRVRKWPKPA